MTDIQLLSYWVELANQEYDRDRMLFQTRCEFVNDFIEIQEERWEKYKNKRVVDYESVRGESIE